MSFDPEADTLPDLGTDLEVKRREVVNTFDLSTLEGHPVFEDAAEAMAAVADTEEGYVAVMRDETQVMMGFIGDFTRRVDRKYTLCNHTLADQKVTIVEDAREDDRFKNLPIVKDDQKIVFYVGIPLAVKDIPVGTLCAAAPETRSIDDPQRAEMYSLARHVERFLEVCFRYPEDAPERALVSPVVRTAADAVYSRWQAIPAEVDRKMVGIETQVDELYDRLADFSDLPKPYQFSSME